MKFPWWFWIAQPRFMWRMRKMKKRIGRETKLGYMQIGGKGTKDEQLEAAAFLFALLRMGHDIAEGDKQNQVVK